eukprot:TRINITY_DN308_c0_g1_i1.p1 TRINITY_DN308_c0_g1~~TRINITY_DN308_c0_g1_i1.p1  ORF type:complete len:335 (+),score=52.18 TRINITY_DN308_c0_g1_i1:35-1039(+)
MRTISVFFILFLASSLAFDYTNVTFDPVHNPCVWNSLLQQYVKDNVVIDGISTSVIDYFGIASNPNYTVWLSSLTVAKIDGLNESEYYSFFVNVYNTFAITLVINRSCKEDLFGRCGPISSVNDIGSVIPSRHFDTIMVGIMAGKEWSLSALEDAIFQAPFQNHDPRIHFTLVKASISSPNLRKWAYNYLDFEQQLNDSFNQFVLDTTKGMHIDYSRKIVTLSPIFSDFEMQFSQTGDLIDYILPQLEENTTQYLWLSQNKEESTVMFFDQNWAINAEGSLPCNKEKRPCYPLWAFLVTLAGIGVIAFLVMIVIKIKRKLDQRRLSGYFSIQTD